MFQGYGTYIYLFLSGIKTTICVTDSLRLLHATRYFVYRTAEALLGYQHDGSLLLKKSLPLGLFSTYCLRKGCFLSNVSIILHVGLSGMWGFCFLVMIYVSKDLPTSWMHVVGKVIGCHGAEGINVGPKTYGA